MRAVGRHGVLYAASEAYPFAKSGGLADVAYSLPKALAKSVDIAVVLPLYRSVDTERFGITLIEASAVAFGGRDYPVELYGCVYDGVPCYFVYSPLLSERDHLYGPPGGAYEDNDLRFAIFCHGVVALAKRCGCGVLHLNDWQTALCALLLHEMPELKIRTLFTLHNLAYQGVFGAERLKRLGISKRHFTMEGVEFYGQINLMKAAIGFSDRLTTVSAVYAGEILTERFGCGLEGYLRRHSAKLEGMLNGIDTDHFDPASDPALPMRYDSENFTAKRKNKTDYAAKVALAHSERPLLVMVSRMTWQKGVDLLLDALPRLLEQELNLAILGEGEARYLEPLAALAAERENLHVATGYDEGLSHRMYAAADFLLMPSRFEPCGLNQMIAMRYGTLPVVHAVGGLAESVRPFERFAADAKTGFGVTFAEETAEALIDAVERALRLYEAPERFGAICRHNMHCDFSWRASAAAYLACYRRLEEGGE